MRLVNKLTRAQLIHSTINSKYQLAHLVIVKILAILIFGTCPSEYLNNDYNTCSLLDAWYAFLS